MSQAEAYLQLCDFQSAAACYKQAWLLEPGAFEDRLAFIYYLQVEVFAGSNDEDLSCGFLFSVMNILLQCWIQGLNTQFQKVFFLFEDFYSGHLRTRL